MWLLLFCSVDVTAWAFISASCHIPGSTQSHRALCAFEKPSVSFTVSPRVFSTVRWRQQSLDHWPFTRCVGEVGMEDGESNWAGSAWTSRLHLWCLHPGLHSCGHPSHPPHRAHLCVPGAAPQALWHQSANLISPGTPGPCSVIVLSFLEESGKGVEGVDAPPSWPGPVLCPPAGFPPLGWLGLLILPWPGLTSVSFVPFPGPPDMAPWPYLLPGSPHWVVLSSHPMIHSGDKVWARLVSLCPPPWLLPCLASREKLSALSDPTGCLHTEQFPARTWVV